MPVGKHRRGGYIFVTWKSDHPPRHVHVYRDGRLVVKWDLDNQKSMKGTPTRRVLEVIAELRSRGPAMKIRSVKHNNRKKTFELRASTRSLVFPFANQQDDKDAGQEEASMVGWAVTLASVPMMSINTKRV